MKSNKIKVLGIALVIFIGSFGAVNVRAEESKSVSDLGLYAIGFNVGYVNASATSDGGSNGGTLGLGFNADIGVLMNKFSIFPNLSYWKKTVNVSNSFYNSSTKASLQEFSIGGDLHYYLNPEAHTNYYVGGGVAMSFLKSQVNSSSYSESAIGLKFLAGLETPVNDKTRLTGELSYKVDGKINTLRLILGVTLGLID